jgi:xyloglucan-specific exo-beta-1,4-glucanase
LETWTGITGTGIADLRGGTNNLANPPIRAERLGSLLEAPINTDDNYGSRMKGWLMPPVTGDYVFWITTDDTGELWLSSDDNPENKVRICFVQSAALVEKWTKYPEQKSIWIPLEAGEVYYFEVRPCVFMKVLNVHV